MANQTLKSCVPSPLEMQFYITFLSAIISVWMVQSQQFKHLSVAYNELFHMVHLTQKCFSTQIWSFFLIVRILYHGSMQMAYLGRFLLLLLSIPCERTHCKLQKNVQIIKLIGPSQHKLWLIELICMCLYVHRTRNNPTTSNHDQFTLYVIITLMDNLHKN